MNGPRGNLYPVRINAEVPVSHLVPIIAASSCEHTIGENTIGYVHILIFETVRTAKYWHPQAT